MDGASRISNCIRCRHRHVLSRRGRVVVSTGAYGDRLRANVSKGRLRMNTMWSVVQVNAKRAWSEPWYIITTVGFIVAAMAVAFVISSQPVQYGTLAFVPSASSVASQRLPGDAQPVS